MSYKASLACAGAFAAAATSPVPPRGRARTGATAASALHLDRHLSRRSDRLCLGQRRHILQRLRSINRRRFQPSNLQRSIVSVSPSGVIGGAHIGFNYQIDKPLGGFVLGVEGSIDGTSLHKSVAAGFAAFGGSFRVRVHEHGHPGFYSRPLRHRLGSALAYAPAASRSRLQTPTIRS